MSLFDILPDELFKPLASPSRRFYADLLLSLHEKTFGLSSEAPRRSGVIHEIADFAYRWTLANGELSEEELKTPPEERARAVYQRLCDTGWLIEHKDGYIRLVDLDPDASGLLHVLSAINRGETRTYGGAVVGVLSALESAAANPSERSENIRNAIVTSRDFLAHMRMVSVSLRKVEERILKQTSLREVFRSFFEDFVQKHLIADYKTLHTRNNPFRFRSRIISQCRSISNSSLTILALGEAYHREGRAPSAAMGQVVVLDDLALIVSVFESTESHLAAIDATASRIERRIVNTARYMDRSTRTSEASVLEALKVVASMDDPSGGFTSSVLSKGLPLGPAHIPAPRRERPPVQQTEIRRVNKDEAYVDFLKAKELYHARTRVTPSKLSDFLEWSLGTETSLPADRIEVSTVDDFVAFQRLRELDTIFDGALARRFELTLLPGRIDNGWINCQDFVIRRKGGRKNA